MRTLLFCLLCVLYTTVSSAQDEVTLVSTDGQYELVCKAYEQGILSEIITIRGDDPVPSAGLTFSSPYHGEIALELVAGDTFLYLEQNGTKYYLQLLGKLSKEVHSQTLVCIYSNVKYPPQARSKGITGVVAVDAFLDSQGCLIESRARSDIANDLEQAAIDAIEKCSCELPPVTQNGLPVNTLLAIPIKFRLH